MKQGTNVNLPQFPKLNYFCSSTALTSVVFFLGNHPEYQEEAFQEVQQVLKGQVPTAETVKDLKFLGAVLKETMRMNMPVMSFITRIATEDTEILDYHIPKGVCLEFLQSSLFKSKCRPK